MIYKLEDVTIRAAMRGMFNKDYGDIENFEDLYTQYIDISGMGKDGILGIEQNVFNLQCRLEFMTGWLQIQSNVITYTANRNKEDNNYPVAPHMASINDAQQYGHFINWTGDVDGYLKQLKRIEGVEKFYKAQLNIARKELTSMQNSQTPLTTDARNNFFTLLAIIGKNQQHAIDKDQTSWYEFAVMVKMYNDMVKQNNKHA